MLKPYHAALAAVALAVLVPTSTRAQLPHPRLQSLSRPGMQAGTTVDVTLRGTDLEGADQLWFDHPGLRAFRLKGATFRVVCATGTPASVHELRAVGTYGITNPRAFVVGERPETAEAEPNNTPAQANSIALNATVNGEFTATDIDCFAFEGKKGQRIFLDLAAERIDSRADTTLRVLDPAGHELAENRDTFNADPFLDLTLPSDGRYTIKVHDVVYAGSTDYVYRLTLHDGPHVDAVIPVSAPPNQPGTFTLIGRGLGGTPAPELAIDGRPLERKSVTLSAGTSDLGIVPSSAATRRGFEDTFRGASGPSKPFFIAEATDSVVIEKEPNDDAEHAQNVSAPCEISAAFGTPGDADVFRFKAKKGEVWWIEADAEQLGSLADPQLLIQKIVPKGTAQDLATAEDQPDPGAGARFPLGTVDAAVRWQAPEDGEYQVIANDLFGSQRGDARLFYRLRIRPERPDFTLVVVPEAPNQLDALSLRAGGRTTAYAIARRIDGFNGPILVEAVDLPPGVSCDPVVIPAGRTVAPLVFEAAGSAKLWVGTATLVGRTRFGDRKEAIQYVSGTTPLGPDLTREARAGGMVWPPLNPQAPAMAPARVFRKLVLAVRETAPLSVTAKPATVIVAQGHQLPIEVTVARRSGFGEAVALTQTDLPPNVPAVAATIAKTSSTGTVPLFVPKNVPPGVYTFLLRGTGPFPFSKDPNAKQKPNINLNEPSNPITIVVRPAPVNLAVNNKGGALKQGATLEIDVNVSRQNGFTDGVTLTLAAPAALKLSAEAIPVAPGQTAAHLKIKAAPDSPLGAVASVAVRAIAPVRGEPVEVDEPLALTINK